MKKILTGIRSTGTPHLGNILSVIKPSVSIANKNKKYFSFIFIADLHSLIKKENIKNIKNNVYQIISAWLAFGLNIENCIIYRQSDVTEVTELAWYLSCFFPYQRLTLAHAFKNAIQEKKKSQINVGLFTYPILMASDILLYDAEIIPIGLDQLQHIEITRRIAGYFNQKIGKNVFLIPNAFLKKKTMFIPGTDGKKMSKSQNNYINIFSPYHDLKKQIMNIHTDSKSLADKKNPEINTIISIYQLIAPSSKVLKMKKKYIKGGYGYLEAKEALYEYIIQHFANEREKFFNFMKKKSFLEKILISGAYKAKNIAHKKLDIIRKCFNFNSLLKN
ncbi:tryptophan--tRNA ligase [Blattabacterium cuenoti]|uniref:tryptophan--tRNA ligase n=1 Tax=Blattabacterium cuenoti TaxID=1653831 RepID=UPI00163CFD7C|nr:tryptophan--tRNA ligase [Blattabacterium cuenoti]